MTGEITLRGRVLPIGGLKSKILAAHLAGAGMVILPKRNEKDLRDIPEEIRKQLKLVTAETMDEVLAAALRRRPKALAARPTARGRGRQQPAQADPGVARPPLAVPADRAAAGRRPGRQPDLRGSDRLTMARVLVRGHIPGRPTPVAPVSRARERG